MSASITAEGPLLFDARLGKYHGREIVEAIVVIANATRPGGKTYQHRVLLQDFRAEAQRFIPILRAGTLVRVTGFPSATTTRSDEGGVWGQVVVVVDDHRGTLEVLP